MDQSHNTGQVRNRRGCSEVVDGEDEQRDKRVFLNLNFSYHYHYLKGESTLPAPITKLCAVIVEEGCYLFVTVLRGQRVTRTTV